MGELTTWELAQARLALLAARLEGLSVGLRQGGLSVRGGQPTEETSRLLKDHRQGILWHLWNEAARSSSVRRVTG